MGFDMTLEWYHWAVLGLLLMCSELLIPAFVLVWFGLGALIVSLVLLVMPETTLAPQLIVWTITSIIFVFLWFKVFKPHQHKIFVGRSSADVVGETGLLVNDVSEFQKGKVRFQQPLIGSDIWDCVADEAIKAGSRVKVVSVEGSMLRVTKA